MCVLKISDTVMKQAGLRDAREALIEFACRLFDAERITFQAAQEMAGLTDTELLQEMEHRGIRVYSPDAEELKQQVEALERMGF